MEVVGGENRCERKCCEDGGLPVELYKCALHTERKKVLVTYDCTTE